MRTAEVFYSLINSAALSISSAALCGKRKFYLHIESLILELLYRVI